MDNQHSLQIICGTATRNFKYAGWCPTELSTALGWYRRSDSMVNKVTPLDPFEFLLEWLQDVFEVSGQTASHYDREERIKQSIECIKT